MPLVTGILTNELVHGVNRLFELNSAFSSVRDPTFSMMMKYYMRDYFDQFHQAQKSNICLFIILSSFQHISQIFFMAWIENIFSTGESPITKYFVPPVTLL